MNDCNNNKNNKKNKNKKKEKRFAVLEARHFIERTQGLIGRRLLPQQGLLFRQANALHTCFMRYALDVIFLDENGTIIAISNAIKPWRFAWNNKASHFLEIPSLYGHSFMLGDRIDLNTTGENH